jgi:hypothetical protein
MANRKKPLELETSDGFSPNDEERKKKKQHPANRESGGKKRQMQVRKGTMPPYGGERKERTDWLTARLAAGLRCTDYS